MHFNSFITICFLLVCFTFIQDVACKKSDVISQNKSTRQARLKRRGVDKRYYTVYNVPVTDAEVPALPATLQPQIYPQQQANYYPASYYPPTVNYPLAAGYPSGSPSGYPVAYPPAAQPASESSSSGAANNAGLNSITGLVSGLKLPSLPSFAPPAGAQQGYPGAPPAKGGDDDDDDEEDDDDEDDDKDDGLNDDNE